MRAYIAEMLAFGDKIKVSRFPTYCLSERVSGFLYSGNRTHRFQTLNLLSKSVVWQLLPLTSWECVGHITSRKLPSWSATSKHGPNSECQVSGRSSLIMTGLVLQSANGKAFHSVGMNIDSILFRLFQSLHDTNAISVS